MAKHDLDFSGGDGVGTGVAKTGSYAGYFDGNGFLSYNTTPPAILNAFAGDFSLSFWINTTETNGSEGGEAFGGDGIVAGDVPGTAYDFVTALDGGEIGFNTGGTYGDDTLNSGTDINDGNYHHVVITRTGATGLKQIFVDGQFKQLTDRHHEPVERSAPDCDWLCDRCFSNRPRQRLPEPITFQGLLDDIQIYMPVYAFPPDQVAQLYSNPGSTAVGQDFNAALNTTNLTWTTSGDSSWFVESANDNDGVSAAQSGSVTGSQSSTLSVTVTGPGTLTFYWSSIANDPDGGFDYEF